MSNQRIIVHQDCLLYLFTHFWLSSSLFPFFFFFSFFCPLLFSVWPLFFLGFFSLSFSYLPTHLKFNGQLSSFVIQMGCCAVYFLFARVSSLFYYQLEPDIHRHYILTICRVPQFSSGQFSRSFVSHSLQPHELQHARPPCPSPTPQSSLKLPSIESVMPSSHLILCHPLLLLPQIPPSIRVFSNESALHMRWPKYWSFSCSIISSKEHPGLISFRMDCLDLLAVQRALKSLLQHHSSKASILWHSAFFTVQLSHPYMTTGKTIALTRWTFVGKVVSAFEYAI